jgi:hypothetical protein
MLLTTRSRELAAAVAEQVFELRGLAMADFAGVLLEGLPAPEDPQAAQALAKALDGSPAALLAANRVLRSRVQQGDDIEAALTELSRRLQREGLVAIDAAPALQGSEDSLFAKLMQTTEQLTAADRQRLHRIAGLPADAAFGAARAARELDLSAALAADMLERLAGIGWVTSDGAGFRVNALAHALARSLAWREEQAAQTRIVRATPKGLKIYLSHRRDDVGYATRIHDRLTQEFGVGAVFFDRADILPGADWHAEIERAVLESSAVVAVMGPGWQSPFSDKRAPGSDWVATELALALERGMPIIPVLVGEAVMPAEADLPREIAALSRRNALELRDDTLNRGLDRLVEALQSLTRRSSASGLPTPGGTAPPPQAPDPAAPDVGAGGVGVLGTLVAALKSLRRQR